MIVLTKGRVKLNDVELGAYDLAYIPANFEVGLKCKEETEAILISIEPEYRSLEELKSILRRFG